jgi:uncharacterized protein YjbI with pentapeptide repeats
MSASSCLPFLVVAFLLGASPAYGFNEGHLNRLKTTGDCSPLPHRMDRGCGLSRADLRKAALERANLLRADLSFANLSGANLAHAELSNTSLYGANLSSANLWYADLGDANLTGADLKGAILTGVVGLSTANLCNARMPDGTKSRQGCK